jgi:hypothetical protein
MRSARRTPWTSSDLSCAFDVNCNTYIDVSDLVWAIDVIDSDVTIGCLSILHVE